MRDLDEHLPGVQAGDPDAFARWVAGADMTVRLSLRSFAAHVDVEAVLQETLLRTWQVAPRFVHDGRENGLLRLAIRIARNLAVSERRRTRPELGAPGEDALPYEPHEPDPMLRKVIDDCRRGLPDKPALALDARLRSGGAEPDEILAGLLHMRINTFLQNVGRARKLMADCLARRGVRLEQELV